MIDAILKFSVKNKLIIGILTLVLTGFGIYSYINLPIDAAPHITNNQVQVERVSPSLAPKKTEHFITFSVELYLYGRQNISARALKDKINMEKQRVLLRAYSMLCV